MITNLLDNAIKYVNEGGKIKISSKTKGKKAFISVFNDGHKLQKKIYCIFGIDFIKQIKQEQQKIVLDLDYL